MSSAILKRMVSYGGVTGLAQGATFVILALYSRWLSPTEYGSYSLVTSVVALGAVSLTFGLLPAFFRFYPKYPSVVPQTVLAFVSLVLLIVAAVAAASHNVLAPLVFGTGAETGLYWIVLTILIVETLLLVPLTHLRGDEESFRYALVVSSKTTSLLIAGVVLVGGLDLGIEGAVLALATGSVTGLLASFVAKPPAIGGISIHLMRRMLAFGLPLQPTIMLTWGLSYADRYLLVYFASLSVLASYSAVIMLVTGINGFLQAGFNLLWPPVMYRLAERDDARAVFGVVATAFVALLFWINLSLALLGEQLLAIFAPEYVDAAAYLPLIAFAYALYSPFVFVNSALQIGDATQWILFAVFCGVTANIVANIALIPVFGAVGSALGLVIGYGTLTGIAWPQAQRTYPIEYQWTNILVLMSTAVLAFMTHLIVPSTLLGVAIAVAYGIFAGWTILPVRDYSLRQLHRFVGT